MTIRPRMTARAAALLAPLLLASCTGDAGEGVARSAPFNSGRQLAISDQLHNNGTAGFVFLPPMVPRPAYFGDFLPDLDPVVRIDEVRPDGTTLRTLATFTRDSGPGRERIRVHHQGRPCDPDDDDGDDDPNGYFYARWFTHNQHLSPSAVYRVRVFVQERVHPCTRNGWGRRCRHGEDNTAPLREVGFADVDIVRNHHEARCVDRAEFVPLVNGRVLRIKFRIDRPVVDADGDGVYNWRDNCRTVANASQLDTNRDGQGDACECTGVTCVASDACHAVGTCNPTNGMCSNPVAADGTACALANAAGACAAGACGVATCNPGYANCDGSATNGCEQSTTTLAHCGGCGVACASGAHSTPTCATGTCGLTCESGWADADGDRANGCELDITTDANCGAPGNACVSTAGSVSTCVSGACSTMACPAGRANCNSAVGDGCEVDTTGDVSHCGACGTVCSVPNATPACTSGACGIGSCNAGFDNCNADGADGCEVNTLSDLSHCGACGNACALANAAPVCAAGACAIGSCTAGFADVDGIAANGCEVNLATDPRHCGAPGNACSAANGTAGCAAGVCTVASCDVGFDNCDGDAANGCERDLRSDVGHCGTCGTACPSGANSAASCAAGACVLTCATGYSNCDGDAANGCEVDNTSDGANCGACGTVCTQGRTCQAGTCTASVCTAGLANCNGSEADGCEVTLATSVAHCGACGNACSFANAAAECTAGACGFSVCNPGFADVDGLPGNGCEVNLLTDANHCGAVGNACSVANGSAVCVSGACAVGACAAGFGNCDGSAANGCEVNLGTSTGHCGACGTACGAGQACTNGSCASLCGAGLVDCAGTCRNLSIDNANCGACGRACPSGQACVAGACTLTCPLGEFNCGGTCVNRTSNSNHCGACGNVCGAGRVCSGGTCQTACASGNTLCGTQCVTLGDNVQHCGACNNACALGNICASGACVPAMSVDTIGCADGTREAFTNLAQFPRIAACAGAWSLPGIFPAIPASTVPACATSGNSSTTAPSNGAGCASSNLCAIGWRICNGGDVLPRTQNVGCGATPYPASSFFSASVSGPGCYRCALRSNTRTTGCTSSNCLTDCQESGHLNNDFFGCGSLGRALNGPCDGLDRTPGDNCNDARGTTWSCNGNFSESRTVTKLGPANGGVLCCRD